MTKRSLTILIVEDEEPQVKVLADHLHLEGFTTLRAKNGLEGLELALKNHPNLILLDIILPSLDGLTMLKMLRADEWGKRVPVIILTNLSDGDSVTAAAKAGVYDFLVKADWTLDNIMQKIKERLA